MRSGSVLAPRVTIRGDVEEVVGESDHVPTVVHHPTRGARCDVPVPMDFHNAFFPTYQIGSLCWITVLGSPNLADFFLNFGIFTVFSWFLLALLARRVVLQEWKPRKTRKTRKPMKKNRKTRKTMKKKTGKQ